MLLNSYLGFHHLTSQLLQNPFPDHWQAQLCPDGVLIHDATVEIISPSHIWLLFLLIFLAPFPWNIKQPNGLPFQGLFNLIAHFVQHQEVNLHSCTVHSPCFHFPLVDCADRCLCSVSWDSSPCLWESLCTAVTLLYCSPSTEVPSDQKLSCERGFKMLFAASFC